MKITKRYMIMCEKAKEIQEEWGGRYCSLSDSCVWVPTQEELQEMAGLDEVNLTYFIIDALPKFIIEDVMEWDEKECPFTSIEEVWLAFVMRVLYNKAWNDEKKEWEEI